jgi:hypothetical protein
MLFLIFFLDVVRRGWGLWGPVLGLLGCVLGLWRRACWACVGRARAGGVQGCMIQPVLEIGVLPVVCHTAEGLNTALQGTSCLGASLLEQACCPGAITCCCLRWGHCPTLALPSRALLLPQQGTLPLGPHPRALSQPQYLWTVNTTEMHQQAGILPPHRPPIPACSGCSRARVRGRAPAPGATSAQQPGWGCPAAAAPPATSPAAPGIPGPAAMMIPRIQRCWPSWSRPPKGQVVGLV